MNTNNLNNCTPMMEIDPEMDMKRWEVQQTVTVLANADYYYTKTQVDKMVDDIDGEISGKQDKLIAGDGISISGDVISVTGASIDSGMVQTMIDESISGKAEQSDVEALSAQVASNTSQLLNTYTKPEVNSLLQSYYDKLQVNAMFNNYAKIDNKTLILNENII